MIAVTGLTCNVEDEPVSNSASCSDKRTGITSPPPTHTHTLLPSCIKGHKMLHVSTNCLSESYHLPSCVIIWNCFYISKYILFFYTGHDHRRNLWWTYTPDFFFHHNVRSLLTICCSAQFFFEVPTHCLNFTLFVIKMAGFRMPFWDQTKSPPPTAFILYPFFFSII
jgi:hypothetical protein